MHDDTSPPEGGTIGVTASNGHPDALLDPGYLFMGLRHAVLEGKPEAIAKATGDIYDMIPRYLRSEGRDKDGNAIKSNLATELAMIHALEAEDARRTEVFMALHGATAEGLPPELGWSAGLALQIVALDAGVRAAVQGADEAKRHATTTWNMLQCLMMVYAHRMGMTNEQLQAEMAKAQAALVEQAKQAAGIRHKAELLARGPLTVVKGGVEDPA